MVKQMSELGCMQPSARLQKLAGGNAQSGGHHPARNAWLRAGGFKCRCSYDAIALAAPLMNASKSALMVSALVVGIPCGKPL